MAQVNIRKLFDDKQERLALSWVAGSDGSNKILDATGQRVQPRMIGHQFDLTNWVQVLSTIELDYLRDLSAAALATALKQLEGGGSLCLIVAGTDEIPQSIIDYANRTQTPLFRSPQGSVHLMWLVRHYIVKELAESTTRHGVFLDVLGVGVLITGDSGVGKSELGLELITRGNGLVADDVTELFRISPETLEGRCPELLRDFLEVRGLGMLNIRTMFGETSVA
jgi:HPr kinase/phosphorylase